MPVEQQSPMPEVPPVPTTPVPPQEVPPTVQTPAPVVEKEESPVKVSWKKPIIWMLIIGAVALALMFLIKK